MPINNAKLGKSSKEKFEWMLSGDGFAEFQDGFSEWAEFGLPDEYAASKPALMAECRKRFGLFRRPHAYWRIEARGASDISEARYINDHPEIQTDEEKNFLKHHEFPRWLLRARSDWYSPEEYLRGQGLQHYLEPDEMEDLKKYVEIRDTLWK